MLCFRTRLAYAQASPQNWDRGHSSTVYFTTNKLLCCFQSHSKHNWLQLLLPRYTKRMFLYPVYCCARQIVLIMVVGSLMPTFIWKEVLIITVIKHYSSALLTRTACNVCVYSCVSCASSSLVSTLYKHLKRPFL